MIGATLHQFLTHAELLVAIAEAIAAVITILEAIRRDPKDRVLLFEFLAIVTFCLGALFAKLAGLVWPALIVWMVLFLGFTFAAFYFAVINWLRRIKKAH